MKTVLAVLVSAALLLIVAQFVDWPALVALLRHTDSGLLAVSGGLYVLVYLARALRVWLLVPRAPYATMLGITCVYNLLLRVMPFKTGELSYAFLLKKTGVGGVGEGVVTVLWIRILDAATVVLLFAIFLVANLGQYRGDPRLALGGAAAVLAIGVLCLVYFAALLRRIPWLREAASQLDALPRRRVGELTVVTMVQWVLLFASMYVLVLAFGVDITPAQAVLGGTGSVVSGFLPLGGVGSFGALEAGWALGFALVGLPSEIAVATAFGYSLVTLAFAILFALGGWILLARARSFAP